MRRMHIALLLSLVSSHVFSQSDRVLTSLKVLIEEVKGSSTSMGLKNPKTKNQKLQSELYYGLLDLEDDLRKDDPTKSLEVFVNYQKIPLSFKARYQAHLFLKALESAYEVPKELTQKLQMTTASMNISAPQEVCHLLAQPGDILLRSAEKIDGNYDQDFSKDIMRMIRLTEILKLNPRDLRYRHAEVLTSLPSFGNMKSISYYPPRLLNDDQRELGYGVFTSISNDFDSEFSDYLSHRRTFSIVRVKARNLKRELKKKERALTRAHRYEDYPQYGVCSDFVNWTYRNEITSNWNFIPGVKQLVQRVYLPEYIQTPDNLYDSYKTEEVCQITKRNFFPKVIDLKSLVKRLKLAQNSSNLDIQSHAEKILSKLHKKDLIDDLGITQTEALVFQRKASRF